MTAPSPAETTREWPADLPGAATLERAVRDARRRTFALVDDLDDDELLGERLAIVNPLLWEIGHVAWFQERWVLREALGREPLREDGDRLYDSSAVAHDTRWDLPLPSRRETYRYLNRVEEAVLDVLAQGDPEPAVAYHVLYTVGHEDMHGEAFLYTRQTHGLERPAIGRRPPGRGLEGDEPWPGDVEVAGATHLLGARRDGRFAYDNEKWAHEVELAPFRIARAPVTQGELRDFVEDGGYRRRELWSEAGWEWREREGAQAPLYWHREGGEGGGWIRREFDTWAPVSPHLPAVHVNAWEAEAWCRWAGRRLPTEAEWEAAAGGGAAGTRYPWGEAVPETEHANLDGDALGCVGVAAHAAGDSPAGCRQMIGNVWEWTASAFGPFPGFTPDPYRDYSAPWFGTHRVLRGGAWPTRSRLARSGYRNYAEPHRRDLWAGLRTCARD